MSIFDKLFKRNVKTATLAQPIPEWLAMDADAEKFTIPDASLYRNQADLYQRLTWLQLAVSLLANSCAVVPLSVKRAVGEKTEEIQEHPFEIKQRRPNPLVSRFELWNNFFSFHQVTGNGYLWLNKASENAPPDEIWNIASHKIQPVPDRNMYIDGYAFTADNGETIKLETWEVVHMKQWNPLNSFVGLSKIEALAIISVGDLKMQEWNTRFFGENNARLPGILAFADQIEDGEWKAIKKDTRDRAAKRELMMLRGAGQGGVQWLQAASTLAEMEFQQGRRMNKQEIFDMIAPGLFGMLSENATEANARTAKATFTEFAQWSLLEATAQKVTNDILPSYGDNLIAEFDDVRVTDRALELTEQQEFSRTHTVDEIRIQYYNDKPLGDSRGALLPVQIGQSAVLEPGVEENANITNVPQMEQQDDEPNEQPGEMVGENISDDLDDDAIKALMKWEGLAVKKFDKGQDVDFDFNDSDAIPAGVKYKVTSRLKMANTLKSIKAAFIIEQPFTVEQPTELSDITKLALSIKEATQALRETEPDDGTL